MVVNYSLASDRISNIRRNSIMKQEHLAKLQDIIETSLQAHQRAKWEDDKARNIIAKSIVKRFKSYLALYEKK